MTGFDVVLIQPNPNICRLNFYKLRKRILQPPTDRDSTTHRSLMGRQFFAGIDARRVNACAGFVDDYIANVEDLQFASH